MTAEKLLEHQGAIFAGAERRLRGLAVSKRDRRRYDDDLRGLPGRDARVQRLSHGALRVRFCGRPADARHRPLPRGTHGLRRERQLGRLHGGAGYEARFARAAHGHVPLSVLPLPWADGRVRPKHCERVAAVRGQGLSRDAGEDCRALAARQHAARRPRGRADGAHLRRDVPRAGKDPHPVLQGQDFRAAALPRRDDYSAGGKRASVLLQNAGRKGRGHQALFNRACGGKFHAGGATPTPSSARTKRACPSPRPKRSTATKR